jgi:hypothetical protein
MNLSPAEAVLISIEQFVMAPPENDYQIGYLAACVAMAVDPFHLGDCHTIVRAIEILSQYGEASAPPPPRFRPTLVVDNG